MIFKLICPEFNDKDSWPTNSPDLNPSTMTCVQQADCEATECSQTESGAKHDRNNLANLFELLWTIHSMR